MQWQPAKARIEGTKVVVSSPVVPKPVAIRYAWEDDPKCNLFNAADLPASPFRTDDWTSPSTLPIQPKR
jgi:sialate O-acetylesterase